MKRSAMAFARGARTGVPMMRMSAPANTASKAAGELAVPVADQELELLGAVAEIQQEVAGLLSDPGAGGVGGDSGEVHAAAALLDHDEDVERSAPGREAFAARLVFHLFGIWVVARLAR
jgi:hypothetical protein